MAVRGPMHTPRSCAHRRQICNRRPPRQLRQTILARNRLLFEASELPGATIGCRVLLPKPDSRATHIQSVLGLNPGDSVKVGVVQGLRADAQVTHITPEGDVQLCITRVYPPLTTTHPVDLLLALPRPKVLKRLWPVLGELGVRSVVLTGAHRVEKTFFAAGAALDPQYIRAGLVKGLEQAGDTQLPDVVLSRTLKGALTHLEQRQGRPVELLGRSAHGHGVGEDRVAQRQGVSEALGGGGGTDEGCVEGSVLRHGGEKHRWGPVDGSRQRGDEGGNSVPSQAAGKAGLEAGDECTLGAAAGAVHDIAPGTSKPQHQRAAQALPWGVSYLVGSWPQPTAGTVVPTGDHVCEQSALKVVGHPYAQHSLLDVLLHHRRSVSLADTGRDAGDTEAALGGCVVRGGSAGVVVAVGPEGGWWQDELDLLTNEYGFVPVGLGPRVLTTTTALVSMVTCVQQAVSSSGDVPVVTS